jgi:hypothetical protein
MYELPIAGVSLSNPQTQLLHATFILEKSITPNLATKETQPETRKSQRGLKGRKKERKGKRRKKRKKI